jgi:hypothetical protein
MRIHGETETNYLFDDARANYFRIYKDIAFSISTFTINLKMVSF